MLGELQWSPKEIALIHRAAQHGRLQALDTKRCLSKNTKELSHSVSSGTWVPKPCSQCNHHRYVQANTFYQQYPTPPPFSGSFVTPSVVYIAGLMLQSLQNAAQTNTNGVPSVFPTDGFSHKAALNFRNAW